MCFPVGTQRFDVATMSLKQLRTMHNRLSRSALSERTREARTTAQYRISSGGQRWTKTGQNAADEG